MFDGLRKRGGKVTVFNTATMEVLLEKKWTYSYFGLHEATLYEYDLNLVYYRYEIVGIIFKILHKYENNMITTFLQIPYCSP